MSKDFYNISRIKDIYRPQDERKNDYQDVERSLSTQEIIDQAKRCMDCGVPFCHGLGCPLKNLIPEINAAVLQGNYQTAWELLSSTSSMPEFTSRVCPALCEGSCTASIDLEPVMIRQLEKIVVENAFTQNWVQPTIPASRNGKKVAVIGSGPAGLAMAIELNKKGYLVTIFEKNAKAGGLLRYGIPEFKLEKWVIDRRVDVMIASGISFEYNTEVGNDISIDYLSRSFDAVAITSGTPVPRNLEVAGRELDGIDFALDFLNGKIPSVEGQKVLIIGGGDTGSDCVGTSVRQHASSILQVEIMPKPPAERSESTPWPLWPYLLRTSSSQKEGGERRWDIQTKEFVGENGKVVGVNVVTVEWTFSDNGKPLSFNEVADSEEFIPADRVFLAMGFLKPTHSYTQDNIFVAGDAILGPSLVVRAIADAKNIANQIDDFLR